NHRRFLAIPAITIAALQFGVTGSARAQSNKTNRHICVRSRCSRWSPQQLDYPLSKPMSHHYSGPDWGFPLGDSRLDLTDLYAFPKPGDAAKSILVMNVHPSAHDYLDRENPLGPTTTEAFAPEALYEIKIDANRDAVAEIAY